MKLYVEIARIVGALSSRKNTNPEWATRWKARLDHLMADHMPNGSGFDCGITLDLDRSSEDRLYLLAPFHAMDPNGYYDGWREYRVAVRASLAFGFTLSIAGPDSDGLKDYIADTIHGALSATIADPQTGSNE